MELTLQETRAVQAAQAPSQLAHNSPAGIMLSAMERGISPADLRDMLALQREWNADQARAAFNAALAAFKFEPIKLVKSRLVGYVTKQGEDVGYRHAELSDVVDAVGPALSKHGLSFRWDVKQTPTWISVTCILKHALGHSESCELGGPPDASGKKNAIQQIASTVTYLQRYTLKAITGVAEGGQDDDGEGGEPGQAQEGSTPDANADMRAAGLTAAANGLESLTAWWKGLDSKEQSELSKDFGDMRKTARRIDQEKTNG